MRAHPPVQLIGELAVGGMARLDHGEMDGQKVVVKRLLPHLADDPRLVAQLVCEGSRMQRLAHEAGVPDVYAVHDPRISGAPLADAYVILELVPGVDLGTFQEHYGPRLPLPVALPIVRRLAEIVHAVHTATDPYGEPLELVHRDLCPANVIVGDGGRLAVVDFGVASARWPQGPAPSADQGRAAYMAPEQLRGLEVDHRADVFAIGVIAFELISGTRLYRSGNRLQVMAQVMDGVRHRLSERGPCPSDLEDVVATAMSSAREDRQPTAAALAAELAECERRHG